MNDLTYYSSILLHLLPPREPLTIIAQIGHHFDHGIILLNCAFK